MGVGGYPSRINLPYIVSISNPPNFKLIIIYLYAASLLLCSFGFAEFRFSGTSSTKLNEPKKRTPEMTNSPWTCACYTCLIGATGRCEFSFAELPSVGSRHFRYPLAPSTMNFSNIMRTFWISNGLREFWEIATVLKIAARACCKQYCLRRTKDDELYCVGKLKNRSPKIICSLDFFLVTFFVLRQRK